MEDLSFSAWNTLATCYAKNGERRRTMPNAPHFSQLSPLPETATPGPWVGLLLREGGLGVGQMTASSLSDYLLVRV